MSGWKKSGLHPLFRENLRESGGKFFALIHDRRAATTDRTERGSLPRCGAVKEEVRIPSHFAEMGAGIHVRRKPFAELLVTIPKVYHALIGDVIRTPPVPGVTR